MRNKRPIIFVITVLLLIITQSVSVLALTSKGACAVESRCNERKV